MNRQYQDSFSTCCCGRSEHSFRQKYSSVHPRDSSSEEEKGYHNCGLPRHDNFCKNNPPHNNFKTFDDQSWNGNTFSTLREKPCQYAKSEMEEATAADPSCSQDTHRNKNLCRNSFLLRRANNLIDYAPESEFLKKIKQQCRYLENSQPNIFFSIDDFIECDDSPYECQKCEVSSDPVSRQRDHLNCDKFKSVSERSWKCTCNQQLNLTSMNDDQVYNKNLANVQRLCKEFTAEKQVKEKKQANGKSKCIKKKSEHVSRSKKPSHCGERRKRKSVSSEKCESNNQFEPTLKKPHENSCERCWRFASPSRSPVNKPDQKFDPNFRKGRSCTDLEKGDGDIANRESQFESVKCEKERVTFSEKERSPSPFCCTQQKSHVARGPPISVMRGQDSFFQPSGCTSTKVKETLIEQSLRRPLENYLPSSQTYRGGLPECNKVLLSDSKRKSRLKSCTPGSSPSEAGKCPNNINDLGLRDFKTTCMNPWKHCCETFNPCKSLKTPGSEMPTTSKESCNNFSKGGSPGKSFDPSNLKPIPEAEVASSKENKNDTSKGPKNSKNLEETLKTQSKSKNQQSKTNLKSSVPKKPDAGATKSKGNENSASSKAKNDRLKSTMKSTKLMKKSTQVGKFQTSLDKYKCPQDIVENFCADKEKSEPKISSGSKSCHYNSKPSCGNSSEYHCSSHPVRNCCCYPRAVKTKNSTANQNDLEFCCHCNWGENQNNQTSRHSFKSNFDIHPFYEENVTPYREPNIELNERHFIKNSDLRPCNCDHTLKTSSPESSFGQSFRGMRSASPRTNADFSGKMLSCPYRDYANKLSSKFPYSPENGETQTWDEYQPSKKNQKARENKEQFLGCSPRKYFVFYMTQSKEPKKKDDVEVLVEEFGQTCADAKDTKTKDIAEKMKKILECPSDSMALRFQKGVTETCKTPPSSRTLYF